jgi:two-component system, OmpR family, response regulator AdeR
MNNELILVVEVEIDISAIIVRYLVREGFRVVTADSGSNALVHHQMLKPDLVLLDVCIPGRDGYEVLSEVRRRGDTPVVMTTALADDLDKLTALRLGADDYIVKPYNPLEVVARVKAVLRRAHGRTVGRTVRVGAIEIDAEAYAVRLVRDDNRPSAIDLTLTEFRILSHMARAPNRVFARSELLDACLPEGDALERTVDSHIRNIRRKLDRAGASSVVDGVRGVGYRLEAA